LKIYLQLLLQLYLFGRYYCLFLWCQESSSTRAIFLHLPRWQFNWFNVFLTSLGLASLVVAGFAVTGNSWVFLPALVLALLYIIVCFLDLLEIFPVVKDKLPVQLLILEAIVLGSAGVLLVIAIAGLRI
jgi:hypothetical protein